MKTKDHQAVVALASPLGFLAGHARPARLRVFIHTEAHNDVVIRHAPNSRAYGHTVAVAAS